MQNMNILLLVCALFLCKQVFPKLKPVSRLNASTHGQVTPSDVQIWYMGNRQEESKKKNKICAVYFLLPQRPEVTFHLRLLTTSVNIRNAKYEYLTVGVSTFFTQACFPKTQTCLPLQC